MKSTYVMFVAGSMILPSEQKVSQLVPHGSKLLKISFVLSAALAKTSFHQPSN